MSVINIPLADFFTRAALILDNAQEHAEISAALNTYGYNEAAIQEGRDLLNVARNLYDSQIKEYGEQHAATKAFHTAFTQADKTYNAHRRLAKIVFKNDPQRQTDLRLNQRKPYAFNAWYQQARHFYAALLSDEEAQTKLARFNVTVEDIQAAQAQVEQTQTLKNAQEQEKGEAQQATQQRDAAIAALDEWLADFQVVAKIALQDKKQLLESLDMGVIPS